MNLLTTVDLIADAQIAFRARWFECPSCHHSWRSPGFECVSPTVREPSLCRSCCGEVSRRSAVTTLVSTADLVAPAPREVLA